jgi:hypothetical protein
MSRTERLSTTAIGGLIIFLTGACGVSDRMEKSRLRAEETAAIQTVKTVQTGQVQYFSQYGTYAKALLRNNRVTFWAESHSSIRRETPLAGV